MHPIAPRFLVLSSLVLAGAVTAGAATPLRSSSPRIITPPAINDGSIASRAPFLAARPFDDSKAPDGQAYDAVPPNTASTTPLPLPAPPPKIAIFQPAPSTDPGTSPTGRVVSGISAPLDAGNLRNALRTTSADTRQEVISELENRVRASETALAVMRGTQGEMSAEGRAQFRAATSDLKSAERPLRKSILAARKADGAGWEAARGRLESDFNSYAQAVARIDAAAGITPPPR